MKKIMLLCVLAITMWACALPPKSEENNNPIDEENKDGSTDKKEEEIEKDDTTQKQPEDAEKEVNNYPIDEENKDGSTDKKEEEIGKDDTTQKQPEDAEKEEKPSQELPASMRYSINIPQYVQEKSYYCSVACLQSVMAYHGLYATQDELAKELKTDPVTGTEYADLARVATARIFPSGNGIYQSFIPSSNADRSVFESRLIQDMKSFDPVFVSINNRIMYEDVPDQVHQVVVTGIVVEDGQIVQVTFFDPSYTRQDVNYGGMKMCTGDELWKAMIQNPEPGYVY